MSIFRIVIIVFMIWLPSTAHPEFYQYRDKNGVQHFTDNLAEIPKDQLSKINSYNEPDDFHTEKNIEKKEQLQTDAGQKKRHRPVIDEGVIEIKKDIGSNALKLQKIKDKLDIEYASLMKEKQALDEDRKNLKTAKEVRKYQVKVVDLNQKIADFEQRRKLFKKEVNAFNATTGE